MSRYRGCEIPRIIGEQERAQELLREATIMAAKVSGGGGDACYHARMIQRTLAAILALIAIGPVVGCDSHGAGPGAPGASAPGESGAGGGDDGRLEQSNEPWSLSSPELGEGINVVGLAEGPDGSVLVTTSTESWLAPVDTDELALHRVDRDGSVRWSVPIPSLGTCARLDDARVVVPTSDRRGLLVIDSATGEVSPGPRLDGTVALLSALRGGGVTGIIYGDQSSDGAKSVFRWSGGPASVDEASIDTPRTVYVDTKSRVAVADEQGTFWFTVGWDLLRVGKDGTVTKLPVLADAPGTPRPGGGIFVRGGGEDVDHVSSILELDSSGKIVATIPIVERLREGAFGSIRLEQTPERTLVMAGLFSPNAMGPFREQELRIHSLAGNRASVTYGVSDRAEIHASASTSDGVWLGGEFRGHLRIGQTELRSGYKTFARPLLLRLARVDALPTDRGVGLCAAESTACRACRRNIPECAEGCTTNECIAGRNDAFQCACRAPEDLRGCLEAHPESLAFEGCYTACADACGTPPSP